MKKASRAEDIAVVAVCAALLFVSKFAISFLPNIELVSTLVIVYSLKLGKKTIPVIYIFALMEGLVYGFGIWWLMYLYVWTILYFIVRAFKTLESPLAWAILSTVFGLFFGLLCAIPYFFILGIGGGVSYFLSGIPFDLMHCAGNFVLTLLLFKPLTALFDRVLTGRV